MSAALRVLPLGGLGEIGKNMAVVEYEGRIVVVDTGLMFPTPDQLGVDLVLPDFSYLRERAADIEGIVLTHGHEDHVGALPFVLREIGDVAIPDIYGGGLTVAMVRSKLDEHKLRDMPLHEVEPGDRVELGPFTMEPVKLAHSIPDMFGIALDCELGTTFFTGDYKFDQTPGGRRAGGRRPARRAGQGGGASPMRRLDERRPPRHGTVRVERRPAPRGGVQPHPRADRHHLASRRTSTASSRWSMRPRRPGGRSCSSAGRCAST